jgi:hypothetical protein
MGNRAIEQKSAFAAIERSSKKVLSQQSSDRAKKCFRSNRAIEQKSAVERSSKKRSSKKVLSNDRAKKHF